MRPASLQRALCLTVLTLSLACSDSDSPIATGDGGGGGGGGSKTISFGQAQYCGHANFYHISVANDGTAIVPEKRPAGAGPNIIHQSTTPCGSSVEVETPWLHGPCISPDGKSFVTVWSDSATSHLEIWTRAAGTNWGFSSRIATYIEGDSVDLWEPRFAANGNMVIASQRSRRGSGFPPSSQEVIVTWSKVGGNWNGPDTLKSPGGDPIDGDQYWNPCLSPDGVHLYATSRGPGYTYQIAQFKKDANNRWVYIGEISSAFNIPDVEEIAVPFVTYDDSYIYFGGYDRDGTEPSGIYRAAIIKD